MLSEVAQLGKDMVFLCTFGLFDGCDSLFLQVLDELDKCFGRNLGALGSQNVGADGLGVIQALVLTLPWRTFPASFRKWFFVAKRHAIWSARGKDSQLGSIGVGDV